MKHTTRRLGGKARLMVWTAAGLAGTGLVAGVANAATSSGPSTSDTAAVAAASSNPNPNANPNSAGPQGKSRQALQRKLASASVRGEIVFDGKKGLHTVDFQRGTVRDASSSTFTVTDKSGTAQTWTVTSDTKVRERTPGHGRGAVQGQDNGQGQGNGEGNAASAQIINGESVVVIGSNSDGTLTARLVLVVPATPAPSPQA